MFEEHFVQMAEECKRKVKTGVQNFFLEMERKACRYGSERECGGLLTK